METLQEVTKAAAKLNMSSLRSKNVRIHNRRTSVRLEPEMWEALQEIATLEGCSIHDLCSAISDSKQEATSFTAALRVFLMIYYRSAALSGRQINPMQKKINVLNEVARKPAFPQVQYGTDQKPASSFQI